MGAGQPCSAMTPLGLFTGQPVQLIQADSRQPTAAPPVPGVACDRDGSAVVGGGRVGDHHRPAEHLVSGEASPQVAAELRAARESAEAVTQSAHRRIERLLEALDEAR